MTLPTQRLPADFLDAHARYLEDAGLLHQRARLASADHLYGLSAECGIKGVMQSWTGPQQDVPHVHLPHLWGEFCALIGDRRASLVTSLIPDSPFREWSVSDRYSHRSRFPPDRVDRHRVNAHQVRRLVTRARLEGVSE